MAAPPSWSRRSRNASRAARVLGDGEGDETPAPVPAPSGVVLDVGEAGALDGGAERGHAVLGGDEAGWVNIKPSTRRPLRRTPAAEVA